MLISVDPNSSKPKYQQIISCILKAISEKKLKIGDKLPSINEVCQMTGIAKKTVVQAFDQLKNAGFIYAVQYKGYFIASNTVDQKYNVCLIFNRFTSYKEVVYNNIRTSLGKKNAVSLFLYYNNFDVFRNFIERSVGKFTHYVIIPMSHRSTAKALEMLPSDKVYILDFGYRDVGKIYPSVCQYFEEDIYDLLSKYYERIKRYKKIILIEVDSFRFDSHYLRKGVERFCKQAAIACSAVDSVSHHEPVKGVLYIVVEDTDLVTLMVNGQKSGMKAGVDFGVLSYNESPLKQIIDKGISTISTDFPLMGKSIVKLMQENAHKHIRNPFRLVDRNSF